MERSVNDIFREHVHSVEAHSGLTLPPLIKFYVIELLSEYVDKPDRVPPSEALIILLDRAQRAHEKKTVGDLCLWITGVLPTYRAHRGMRREYYCSIGATAYSQTHSQVLLEIADNFRLVSDFVKLATHDCETLYPIRFTD
jgi:hypothetical protein